MTEMNEREQVCKDYYFRVRKKLSGPIDGSDRQFFAANLREMWSSFEAYLGWKFPATSPKKMKENFCDEYQKYFKDWKMSDSFKESLKKLSEHCPIEDMRPINPEDSMTINDLNKLLDILQVCYRVRSNLDHGSKELVSDTPQGIRNRELVEYTLRITFEILEKTLSNEKLI